MNNKPVSNRLIHLPSLSKRNVVYKSTAARIAALPNMLHAHSPTVLKPTNHISHVGTSDSTASAATAPPIYCRDATPEKNYRELRPQFIPRRPTSINYIPPPTPAGQLAAVNRIRNQGRGKILVIVGNGPSITEAPLELLTGRSGIDLLSINKPDPRLWPTRLWAFCDTSQYKRHEDIWKSYNGTIINSTSIYQQRPGTVQISAKQGFGFARDLTKGFYIGRSTVYANLQTALWMDYDQVYVFGCDMDPAGLNGQLWFYGVNPDAPMTQRRDRFKLEAEHYLYAAGELSTAERARYTFCSAYNSWPFVEKFNRMDHRLAVPEILAQHGD